MAKKSRRKKKVVIKKRFYVFCLIFLLLIGSGVYFGAKAVINAVSDNPSSEQVSSEEAANDKPENDKPEKKDPAMDDGIQPAVMFNDEESEDGEGSSSDDEDAPVSIEEQIRDAVLTSWHVSPLGQRRITVEDTFGKLTRYENWNGGIYYHTKFAETMYITYDDKKGEDGLPSEESVCTSVSIALKKIIEVEDFKPSAVWGDFHKDKSGYGWTDHFYSVLIKDGIKLIVYCDEEGNVNKETHIIVEKV
ncbi:MAG: hypothetical protein E7228_03075 [Clostridiales bacterium]|nr:hypothetical protein [Clostridiales bacterium]